MMTPLPCPSSTAIHSAQRGLQRIVDDLTEDDEIALARIWLIQSAEDCDICQLDLEPHSNHGASLHLVASAGQSRNAEKPEVWNRLGGAFHNFPLNSQKIGRIAATGESLLVHHTKRETVLAHPDWLVREGIQSFFGYPLVRDDRIFGVMAVFSRLRLTERDLRFLQQIADGGVRLLDDAARLTEQDGRLLKLQLEVDCLRADARVDLATGALVASCPASRKLNAQIDMAAAHSSPVLITGARGTGKSLAARLIHTHSPQQNGPFGKLDGASLTRELLTTFPAKGTLLIKNIEQTPLDIQAWLAEEFLSTSRRTSIQRDDAGGPRPRIMATSHADLQLEIAAGRLRHDLYYALSVVEIQVPSLRERREDLPELASEILREICRREDRPLVEMTRADLTRLVRHDWPGNVRELYAVLECAVMQSSDGILSLEAYLKPETVTDIDGSESPFLRADELKQQERANILSCLKRCGWKVYGNGGAAELLGIKPTTLLYRMKVLKIRKPSR